MANKRRGYKFALFVGSGGRVGSLPQNKYWTWMELNYFKIIILNIDIVN